MLAADVGSLPQLCESDSLSLPLTNKVALELGERSHNAQQQVRHWRVLTGERQVLFFEPDVDAPLGKSQDDLTEVIQVTGQAVHRVTNNGVSFPDVVHELLELRPVHVFTRSLVSEPLVELEHP